MRRPLKLPFAFSCLVLTALGVDGSARAEVPVKAPAWEIELKATPAAKAAELRARVPAWINGGADPVVVLEAYREKLEQLADALSETCADAEDKSEWKACVRRFRSLTELRPLGRRSCLEETSCFKVRWGRALKNLKPRLDPLVLEVLTLKAPAELDFHKGCVPKKPSTDLAASNLRRLRAAVALHEKAKKNQTLAEAVQQRVELLEVAYFTPFVLSAPSECAILLDDRHVFRTFRGVMRDYVASYTRRRTRKQLASYRERLAQAAVAMKKALLRLDAGAKKARAETGR